MNTAATPPSTQYQIPIVYFWTVPYLTGFSMGGFGTFHTACANPEMFAAIAPVAGGGEPEQATSLKDVPTWAFHGDADNVVPLLSNALD